MRIQTASMRRLVALAAGCLGVLCGSVGGVQAVRSEQPSRFREAGLVGSEQRAFLNQYCVACHNQRAKVAGLTLDAMDLGHVGDNADVWEKVVRKLRAGVMPPPGQPRPAAAAAETIIASLENDLDRAEARRPHLAAPGVHRGNRAEYTNAVHDLLGNES